MAITYTQDKPAEKAGQFDNLSAILEKLHEDITAPAPFRCTAVSQQAGYIRLADGRIAQVQIYIQADEDDFIGDPE